MLDGASSTVVILLGSCVGLLFLLLLAVLRLGGRLHRIEMRMVETTVVTPEIPAMAPGASETSSGGAFETFLSEDPERRKLPKNEQFKAYRRWRQENGLNWSNS